MKKQTAVGLFVGGALLGAGLALLFAPAPGAETREKVGGWLNRLLEKGRKNLEIAKHEAEHKKEQISAAIRAGKDAYNDARTFENGKQREKVA